MRYIIFDPESGVVEAVVESVGFHVAYPGKTTLPTTIIDDETMADVNLHPERYIYSRTTGLNKRKGLDYTANK